MKDTASRVYERLLILRCQGGDDVALSELVARYSPGLRLFLAKVMGPGGSADDLLQETWFDAYRKINRLRRPESFAAWIFRIARDKAYREARRRPRESVPQDDAVFDPPASEVRFSPEEAHEVRAALDHLPLEQREVIVLRFIEDMSYEEIADVIGRPLGTVRSRIHYAKLALRELLKSMNSRKDVPS